ncbi:MAG: hypothetical protein RSF84_01110 [Ruthenibacterium sp.]
MRSRKILSILSVILAVIIAFLAILTVRQAKELRIFYTQKADSYHRQASAEKEWLITTQLSNGAFARRPTENGTVSAEPYFASFTALALMEGDADAQYRDAVKQYMDWQFSHLNDAASDYNGVAGTIYNYEMTVTDGKVTEERATGEYDSTDSYAAVFLSVARCFFDQYGEKEYLQAHAADLLAVSGAMLATMDDGLTNAKPDYAVKYLMDNAEVFAGCRDLSALISGANLDGTGANRKEFSALKRTLRKTQRLVQRNVNALWNAAGGYYEPAIGSDGKPALQFDWNTFYPCAASQLFPVIFDVASPKSEHSKAVYSSFSSAFQWETLAHYHDKHTTFYWCLLAYAAACMEDTARVDIFLENYAMQTSGGHKEPLYNADSAWTIRTCERMATLYREKSVWRFPLSTTLLFKQPTF